jgi:RNA polymerase sigma-70 factor (ECF subfamily)
LPVPEASIHTTLLRQWVARIQAGDQAARDELLRSVADRLERLARLMLNRYPRVRAWAETGDVLQNALLRLLHALPQVQPGSMRAFYGLAAEQIRRELLDLVRHYHGPLGPGSHQVNQLPTIDAGDQEPAAPAEAPHRLEDWTAFHEAVERLPAEEREVVGLLYYHGWTQAEAAELLQMSVDTVQRRWRAALGKLQRRLREEPEPD